jgi:ribosomal protein S27E
MKRAKSAKVIMEIYTGSVNYVECPHCKTICKGFSPSVIRLKCFHCNEEIILKWDE